MNGEGDFQRAGSVRDLLYITVRLVGLIGEGEEEQWPGIRVPMGRADCTPVCQGQRRGFQKNNFMFLRTFCNLAIEFPMLLERLTSSLCH